MEHLGTQLLFPQEILSNSSDEEVTYIYAFISLVEAFCLQGMATPFDDGGISDVQKFVILGAFPAVELLGGYVLGACGKESHARFKMWAEVLQAGLFVWLCSLGTACVQSGCTDQVQCWTHSKTTRRITRRITQVYMCILEHRW